MRLRFLKQATSVTWCLNGNIENGNGTQTPIGLKFSKNFSAYAKNTPFEIYAHHGVQTVANPPFAENSMGGVLNDEDYGVNGLEFDVRLTRDSVPITMHDGYINIRLTEKSPISGDLDQFTYKFLERVYRSHRWTKNCFPQRLFKKLH